MLRSLPRAASSCCTIRTTSLRSPLRTAKAAAPASITLDSRTQRTRAASSAHAISNPTLADIEKRWEVMPPQEQAELWMALRDRMRNDWADLTLQEKRAGTYDVDDLVACPPSEKPAGYVLVTGCCHDRSRVVYHVVVEMPFQDNILIRLPHLAYWVAFGPHGPRANPYPRHVNLKIYRQTAALVGLSIVIFWVIRQFARPPPKTMNAQWQEATNEYLRVRPCLALVWCLARHVFWPEANPFHILCSTILILT